MHDTSKRRWTLVGAAALVLTAGFAGHRMMSASDESAVSIVEEDEHLRDAVAAPPPVVTPAVIVPSRVAVWASPALRRQEAEKILASRRQGREAGVVRP